MRKIPKTFKKNNFYYYLVKRSVVSAIYRQESLGVVVGWEFHKLRLQLAGERNYKQSDGTVKTIGNPLMERLSGNSEFGNFEKYENALKKFNELEGKK